jgi:2-polyprenyl-3-methyl-5-hydroxy-6-metoxy-1,4-benzoquinol methylase
MAMIPPPLTESLAIATLSKGKTALLANQGEAASQALQLAMQHASTRLEAHNLIERHALRGSFRDMLGVNCEISPADDIFRFFAGHPTSLNPLRDYLADGWRTLSELMLLLEAVDKPLLKARSFLEFASGHGRFTRHLVKALTASRVTVSDVVCDAVEFSTHTFGVAGFQSSLIPEQVQFQSQYDVVFVLSLFSHLPKSTWSRWLKCLYASVAPGGVMVFSTHGLKAAQHDSVTLDADGFFFAPSSESQAIDVEQYGTTFTSEAYVLTQIEQTLGSGVLMHKALLQFWNHQDAYVLCRHPEKASA